MYEEETVNEPEFKGLWEHDTSQVSFVWVMKVLSPLWKKIGGFYFLLSQTLFQLSLSVFVKSCPCLRKAGFTVLWMVYDKLYLGI